MESYFSKLIHKFSVFLFDSFVQIVKVPNFKNSERWFCVDESSLWLKWSQSVLQGDPSFIIRVQLHFHHFIVRICFLNVTLSCEHYYSCYITKYEIFYELNILVQTKYVGWVKMSNDFMNVLFHPHIYCYYVVSTNSYVKITFKKLW